MVSDAAYFFPTDLRFPPFPKSPCRKIVVVVASCAGESVSLLDDDKVLGINSVWSTLEDDIDDDDARCAVVCVDENGRV